MRQTLALGIALFGICTIALAQEESVAPGINDNFQNPNVEKYIEKFEGESRSIFNHRHDIVKALGLKHGMAVGDIGAGTGFFSLLFSDEVGPEGQVYAVDIAKNFVDYIQKISEEHKKTNIEAIVCDERSIQLPEQSIDIAFICDVYHHFEYPYDSLESIHKALKPGGMMVIVDFVRIEGVSKAWTLKHVRCGMGTVIDEAQQAGFDFVEKKDLGMADQYLITFVKRAQTSDE
jgi:ubiquinone/menaquinone biosynthesis C-methylase UbiE